MTKNWDRPVVLKVGFVYRGNWAMIPERTKSAFIERSPE